jgi:hypothetical protein
VRVDRSAAIRVLLSTLPLLVLLATTLALLILLAATALALLVLLPATALALLVLLLPALALLVRLPATALALLILLLPALALLVLHATAGSLLALRAALPLLARAFLRLLPR